MEKFRESVDHFFTLVEELHKNGDVKVEAMILEHDFRTDDCDLFFVCEGKKVINLTKKKNEKEKEHVFE